jgi:hypothetical protein
MRFAYAAKPEGIEQILAQCAVQCVGLPRRDALLVPEDLHGV